MANGRCRLHGGKSTGAKNQTKNQNAVKHGFFAKYLPEETLAIAEAIETQSPSEILWDNIKIQYAAIIRAQRIFYVSHKGDKTVNLTAVGAMGQSFETQNAWDKQEKFMNAQSRAMKELAIMLEKYSAMTENEERLLKLERMRLDIEKVKAETERIRSSEGTVDDGFLDALDGKIDEVWEND